MDLSSLLESHVEVITSGEAISPEIHTDLLKNTILHEIETANATKEIIRLRNLYVRIMLHESSRFHSKSTRLMKRSRRNEINVVARKTLATVTSYYTPLKSNDKLRLLQTTNRHKALELKEKGVIIDLMLP